MRFYTDIKYITLEQEIINKARKFAKEVTPTTDYSDTHQINTNKIFNDHFIGKLGEEAVKKVFEAFGKDVGGPDYKIYSVKYKSWDDDLYIDEIGLAVKAQKRSTAQRFGLSWTFQDAKPRRDIILDNQDAWVCFVAVDDLSTNYLCLVYPPYQIKELVFDEPKLEKLKGLKKVVYAKKLPKLDI